MSTSKEFQHKDYEYEDMEEMIDFIALDEDDTIITLNLKPKKNK